MKKTKLTEKYWAVKIRRDPKSVPYFAVTFDVFEVGIFGISVYSKRSEAVARRNQVNDANGKKVASVVRVVVKEL